MIVIYLFALYSAHVSVAESIWSVLYDRLLCSRVICVFFFFCFVFFCFQAEDGIRDLVRSRGLGDVYKRQLFHLSQPRAFGAMGRDQNPLPSQRVIAAMRMLSGDKVATHVETCLLYTSDAADERSSVDLGGRRIIKKKKKKTHDG